jgi:adenine phosphoribosyltransferase
MSIRPQNFGRTLLRTAGGRTTIRGANFSDGLPAAQSPRTGHRAADKDLNPDMQNAPGIAELRRLIRDVPDFPKPGILFKDITPLLASAAGLALAVEYMAQPFRGRPVELVVGAESRGFIFGTAVAKALSVGFVPIRKVGKLPWEKRRFDYTLEYGADALEIHADALRPGQNVVVIDDLLATGGTLAACCTLVRGLEANLLGVAVLIELTALGGRQRLNGCDVTSVITY